MITITTRDIGTQNTTKTPRIFRSKPSRILPYLFVHCVIEEGTTNFLISLTIYSFLFALSKVASRNFLCGASLQKPFP